jgi:hypothetical protein
MGVKVAKKCIGSFDDGSSKNIIKDNNYKQRLKEGMGS